MHVIHLAPVAVASVLAAVVTALVLASCAAYYIGRGRGDLVRLLSLDGEMNVPAWYATITLLACSVLLWVIAAVRRAINDPWWRHWRGLGFVFVYVSLDEAISIHERLIEPLQAWLGLGGLLYWPWVIAGAVAVAVLGAVYLKFLLALPRETGRWFATAAALFVGGALGVEMIAASWVEGHGQRNIPYILMFTAEETLEMLGVAVFIYALLRYLEREVGRVQLAFAPTVKAPPTLTKAAAAR